MNKIKVLCPATVANLVCGFDILGLALNEPSDIMEVILLEEPKVIIHNRDEFNLPTDPEKNVAGVVFLAAMEKAGGNHGFEVTIEKHIKPGSGIGSSAASAAGATVAAARGEQRAARTTAPRTRRVHPCLGKARQQRPMSRDR